MGKRQETAKQTRAAIVKAAEELISTRGFESASISDIASLAGVSVGSFYTYFGHKKDVIEEIARSHFDSISSSSDDRADAAAAVSSFLMESVSYISSMGVNLCKSWLSCSISSASVPGIPGSEKLEYDTRRIGDILIGFGLPGDAPEAVAIVRTYYGIVACWALSNGATDPVAEMKAFCDGPLRKLMADAEGL